jgi:hypothetical protein
MPNIIKKFNKTKIKFLSKKNRIKLSKILYKDLKLKIVVNIIKTNSQQKSYKNKPKTNKKSK